MFYAVVSYGLARILSLVGRYGYGREVVGYAVVVVIYRVAVELDNGRVDFVGLYDKA